ncbi:hypothetical protein PMI28_00710 [Pseudomonas sp. GM48]|nr:hypothetical protein PMI28_00710 [Pseudomonas sp. GM48]
MCLTVKPHAVQVMPFVGASLLAMGVNDDAGSLVPRGVLESIASELAPTVPVDRASAFLRLA